MSEQPRRRISVSQSSPETSQLPSRSFRIAFWRRNPNVVSPCCCGETFLVHTIAPWAKLTVSIGASDGGVELVFVLDAERGVACDMWMVLQ